MLAQPAADGGGVPGRVLAGDELHREGGLLGNRDGGAQLRVIGGDEGIGGDVVYMVLHAAPVAGMGEGVVNVLPSEVTSTSLLRSTPSCSDRTMDSPRRR